MERGCANQSFQPAMLYRRRLRRKSIREATKKALRATQIRRSGVVLHCTLDCRANEIPSSLCHIRAILGKYGDDDTAVPITAAAIDEPLSSHAIQQPHEAVVWHSKPVTHLRHWESLAARSGQEVKHRDEGLRQVQFLLQTDGIVLDAPIDGSRPARGRNV